MSITAQIVNHIQFFGDQVAELVFDSGELTGSPAIQQLVTLDVGDNIIAVPDIADFFVHGLAVIPPLLNEVEIVLKGAGADTGISLSATRTSVVHLGTPPASIVLSVDEEIIGLRLVWF